VPSGTVHHKFYIDLQIYDPSKPCKFNILLSSRLQNTHSAQIHLSLPPRYDTSVLVGHLSNQYNSYELPYPFPTIGECQNVRIGIIVVPEVYNPSEIRFPLNDNNYNLSGSNFYYRLSWRMAYFWC